MKHFFTLLLLGITLCKPMQASETLMLLEMIAPNPFVIPPEKAAEIMQNCHLSADELLQALIPVAQSFALSPISGYKVGVAGLGKSGTIYLGINLEFLGVPLNEVVHGEQFLAANARQHGETELTAMAFSAAPCGHCRQFLNEMEGSGKLRILTPNTPDRAFSSLLPESFGPIDLGLAGGLLAPKTTSPSSKSPQLLAKAIEAAAISYAPYSQARSGVAIQTEDGSIYCGSYLENAAFNPSLPPLQAALVALVADGKPYSAIKEVILVEEKNSKISHKSMTKEILRQIAPEASFKRRASIL